MRAPGRVGLWLPALGLVAAVAAVYAPVVHHEFLLTDDAKYVSGNPWVLAGLTRAGFAWAWTTTLASSWAPVTWLSYMLDVELYGPAAGGVLFTNALLHAGSALLLFGLLRTTTGRTGPSAFAAALFAVHPVHVESVAWVAERKDVLALCLGLGALWTWAGFARFGGARRYLATALLLALGLLAKPSLVTLPLLMLLLDYWPLRRLRVGSGAPPAGVAPTASLEPRPLGALVLEKLPFLALCLLAGIVTLRVQAGAMAPGEAVAAPLRAQNALVSYALYLGKAVWPARLSVFYPHPDLPGGTPWTTWDVVGAAALLAAISLLVLAARRRPYLLVGWLWFLGALVPMLGLVQVGRQGMADRYAYLPFIGLYVAVAWGADALLAGRRGARPGVRAVALVAACALLGGLALRARAQVSRWRDTRTLFESAREVAPDAPFVLTTLGTAAFAEGDTDRAIALYRQSLARDARDPTTRVNLGVALAARGDLEGALAQMDAALRATPEADVQLRAAKILHVLGRVDEAAARYQDAVERSPDSAEAHQLLARALRSLGRSEEAERHYAAAIDLRREQLRLRSDARAHTELAHLCLEAELWDAALEHGLRATEMAPDDPEALRALALAWLEHPQRRDVPRATALAERAVAASGEPQAAVLMTLARAYAEAGRREEALETARAALAVAERDGPEELIDWIRERIARYEARPGG